MSDHLDHISQAIAHSNLGESIDNLGVTANRIADSLVDARKLNRELVRVLAAASHALRSYQYGNSATELAKGIADECDAAIASVEGAR